MASKQQQLLELLANVQDLAAQLGDDDLADGAFIQQAVTRAKTVQHSLLGPAAWTREIFHSPYLLPSLQTAYDAGWLRVLDQGGKDGVSVGIIATSTQSDPSLVRRLLRFLAAKCLVAEVEIDIFASTNLTSLLCEDQGAASMLKHASQAYSFSAANMPTFFSGSNGYREPTSSGQTPYALAYEKPLWEQLKSDVAHGEAFNGAMAAASMHSKSWMEIFPIEKLKVADDQVMLVDVGGGRGHVLAAVAEKQTGRLILQDKPEVIAQVPAKWESLFESQAHDFFTPQKVLDARAYYLRFVLHDWNDVDCVKILKHIRDAMKPGWSTLLINEHVLPDRGCPVDGAGYDMIMMTVVAAKERSESQWRALVSSVGDLRIEKIWDIQTNGESVIEVVRTDVETQA